MANSFGPRPMDEVKSELLGRAKENRNPFLYTIFEEVAPVINGLRSVDREEWAKAFSSLAAPHEERAAKAEAAGDAANDDKEYLIAYDYHHVARYPAPNSPGKLAAYRKSQELFHKAARYFDPPLERDRDAVQGQGRAKARCRSDCCANQRVSRNRPWSCCGAASTRSKKSGRANPISPPAWRLLPSTCLVSPTRRWPVRKTPSACGMRYSITSPAGRFGREPCRDSWRQHRRILGDQGCAYASSPVARGGESRRPGAFRFSKRLDRQSPARRVSLRVGGNFGLRLRPITGEEWIEYAPKLSLLDQGLLDQPCAPLLCVNGVKDSVFPIADMYLLFEHGKPKSSRLYAGGHMGGGNSQAVIVQWLKETLTA